MLFPRNFVVEKFKKPAIETVSSVGSVFDVPLCFISSDTDEPLLSGSGEVSKECSQETLSNWGETLQRWHTDLSKRPAGVRDLVRKGRGIPEALRGEIWQLLAGCYDNADTLEHYRKLITLVRKLQEMFRYVRILLTIAVLTLEQKLKESCSGILKFLY